MGIYALRAAYVTPPLFDRTGLPAAEETLLSNLEVRIPSRLGPVEPDELSLSAQLCADIAQWNDRYQATYRSDDPELSGFADPLAAEAHRQDGERLRERIATELGQDAIVRYEV